jgi:tripartite-type tricarboxylate transporter receptor subunit TctC
LVEALDQARDSTMPLNRLFRLTIAALLAAASWLAQSQEAYPNRPIKVVVPFPPGGATDILTRAVTEKLSLKLGQPLVIENKPGAGANIGAEAVAKSPADGYTLLMGSLASHSISATYYKGLGYDIRRDFAPISQVAYITNIVVVGADVPAKSVADLVALAKAQPGKLTCASSGTGGLIHLTCEMFKLAAGINLLHVPYKGTSFFLPDMISGQITMSLDNLPPYLAQLKAGKVRALAVTTAKRWSELPEVPTLAEAGLAGYEATLWLSISGPAGMPAPVVQRLYAEIRKALRDTELQASFRTGGVEAQSMPPDELSNYMRTEYEKWGKVVHATGATVN